MIRRFWLFLSAWGIALGAVGQVDPAAAGYFRDALRFSQHQIGGSARFQALGGAGTALGGDISSVQANPAGLGFQRRSEYTFTPMLGVSSTNTQYRIFPNDQNPTQTADSRTTFGLPQLGVVLAGGYDGDETKAFRGGAFSFSVSRVNDFNRQFSYEGVNNATSIIDFAYTEASRRNISWEAVQREINQDRPNSLYSLFTYAYLIDFDSSQLDQNPPVRNLYYSRWADDPRVTRRQGETITQKGRQYDISLAYGANFLDKFYIGATLSIQAASFEQSRNYYERMSNTGMGDNAIFAFNTLSLTDNWDATGAGFNARIGMIYRPIENLRIGLTAQTATRLGLTENFQTQLEVNYNNIFIQYNELRADGSISTRITSQRVNTVRARTPNSRFSYALRTPARYTLGIAYVFGKRGFVTLDAEYIAYNRATLSNPSPSFSFGPDNNTIAAVYRPVLNLRGGAEVRLGQWRVRGGAAYYPDPLANTPARLMDRTTWTFTGGFGKRAEKWYWDVAVVGTKVQNDYIPYTLPDNSHPRANYDDNRFRLMFTYGRFFSLD